MALFLSLLTSSPYAQEETVVTTGNTVGFEFTLKLDDGTVVESNVDGDAFTYVHGEGQILPALESALGGMAVDEEKSVDIATEDAYGPVDPNAFQEIPLENIPETARSVGAQLQAEGFPGPIRIHEIREETAVLDFNHPLAGQALTFDVRILSIE
jgi:FKBP-type peptidyl-prolyl cis-trans isomerase SlyD